jgi:hypothetical protein
MVSFKIQIREVKLMRSDSKNWARQLLVISFPCYKHVQVGGGVTGFFLQDYICLVFQIRIPPPVVKT